MKTCSIVECPEVHHSKGYCKKHYLRWYRWGDPNIVKKEYHGLNDAPERNVWQKMKQRCYNPNDKSYPDYGGRGIEVCPRWRVSFMNFYNDMGKRPSDTHSIERINNDGNYRPSNCKWATKDEQVNNYRHNHFITINGRTQSMKRWVDELGLKYGRVQMRLYRGWTPERALELERSK